MKESRSAAIGERLSFLLVLLAGFLLPSTGLAQTASPVRSLLEIRREMVIVQKWDVSCGAAALATLLSYQHGIPVSERSVVEKMLQRTDPLRVKFRGGFSLLDLKRYTETMGLIANAYSSVKLADLDRLKPAIVPVNFSGYPHFVIYRGQAGNHVLISDPAFGNRVVGNEAFLQAWLQNIAFVVTRPDEKDPPNRLKVLPSDFVRPPSAAVRGSLH